MLKLAYIKQEMLNIRPFEVFLIVSLISLILWLVDDYMASLLSAAFLFIITGVLTVAFISELLEPSRVSRRFFLGLIASLLGILLTAVLYYSIMGGQLFWLAD